MKRRNIPPYFILEHKKQVIFHVPGVFPVKIGIPIWMELFPPDYEGVVVRCEETFYHLRAGAKI